MIRDSSSWVITGTKTFRLGSRKILKTYGGNLQNIEKSAREIYIPDDGKILVQTDQSGAEALIVAYVCRAGAFRQLFIHGVKPHVYVALHVFKDVWKEKNPTLDIDKMLTTPIQALKSLEGWHDLDLLIKSSDGWPASERYYYLAKQTCHSSNYGIEPPTFRMNILEKSGGKINISKEDSERFLMTYHSLFPEIREMHEMIRRQVEKYKCLYNLFGHPYQITVDTVMESKWKEIYSWIFQSTVGMITNNAISAMQEHIEKNHLDWDLLVNGHDSALHQCPIAEAYACGAMQRMFLEQEFESPTDGTKFRMRSETKIGLNWNDFKEDKNPFGLKEIKL